MINVFGLRLNESRVPYLVSEAAIPQNSIVDSPEKAASVFEIAFDSSNRSEEHFWMMALDTARHIKGLFTVSQGTLTAALVHPREVFIRAILAGAASIIIAHNHPSGSLKISEQDKCVSALIKQVGELVGIHMDDHLILAGGKYVSVYS